MDKLGTSLSRVPSENGSQNDHERTKCNRNPIEWFSNLAIVFDKNFLLSLSIIQHISKGIMYRLVLCSFFFTYEAIGGLKASHIQVYKAIVLTPWCSKSLMGVLSDTISCCGYNKRPYMFITIVLAMCSYILLGFFNPLSPIATTMCLFTCTLQISLCDLLSEAKYAEKLKVHPANGPDLMAFVWGGIFLGGLLAQIAGGPIIQAYGPYTIYIYCIPLCAISILPVAFNWISEEVDEKRKCVKVNFERVAQEKKLVILAIIIGTLSLFMIGVGLMVSSGMLRVYDTLYAVLGVSIVLLASFYILTPVVIFKVVIFFFVQHLCSVNIESAAFFFYTDNEDEFPDGPHFSPAFYTSAIGIVSSVFSVLGIMIYNLYMRNWKYRTVFIVNNIVAVLANSSTIIFYKRWNKDIGIPDSVFILGADAIMEIVHQLAWMPGLVMTSQLCPDGMEATMYAILAGTSNLGYNLASYIGACMLKGLHIEPSGTPNVDESAVFENMWLAATISCFLPLIPIFFVPVLIPDAYQTGKIEMSLNEGNRTRLSTKKQGVSREEFAHLEDNEWSRHDDDVFIQGNEVEAKTREKQHDDRWKNNELTTSLLN